MAKGQQNIRFKKITQRIIFPSQKETVSLSTGVVITICITSSYAFVSLMPEGGVFLEQKWNTLVELQLTV